MEYLAIYYLYQDSSDSFIRLLTYKFTTHKYLNKIIQFCNLFTLMRI